MSFGLYFYYFLLKKLANINKILNTLLTPLLYGGVELLYLKQEKRTRELVVARL
jgi:hypothetical protein